MNRLVHFLRSITMQRIGVSIVVIGLAVVALWISRGSADQTASVIAFAALAVFAGCFLILADRVIEVSVRGVGTIKAAEREATAYLEEIKGIKKEIEQQRSAVEEIGRSALQAAQLSSDVSRQHDELKSLTAFIQTVVSAISDDATAFEQLSRWADDSGFRFNKEAQGAWWSLFDVHSSPLWYWADPGAHETTLGEIEADFRCADPQRKLNLLGLALRARAPRAARAEFLCGVMRSDPSLKVREHASRHLKDILQSVDPALRDVRPMETERLGRGYDQLLAAGAIVDRG